MVDIILIVYSLVWWVGWIFAVGVVMRKCDAETILSDRLQLRL